MLTVVSMHCKAARGLPVKHQQICLGGGVIGGREGAESCAKSTAIRIAGAMVPLPVSKWELKAKLGLKNADDMTVTCRAKRILLPLPLLLLLLLDGGAAQ